MPQILDNGTFNTCVNVASQAVISMRPHQWSKNILVLVPLFISHQFDSNHIAKSSLAFVAFSLAASGAYIVNDLFDIEADRAHPRKCHRPFASGTLPTWIGPILAAFLFISSMYVAWHINSRFLLLLFLYLGSTAFYSMHLKKMLLADVVTLGCLYSVRVVAGGVAIDNIISEWLAAFSLLFFISLALIKRYAELLELAETGKMRADNRSYIVTDLPVVLSLATASAFGSITVFVRYIGSEETLRFYSHSERLWLIAPILIYWISRAIMLAHRMRLKDDPVVFALTDLKSLLCGTCVAALLLSAI